MSRPTVRLLTDLVFTYFYFFIYLFILCVFTSDFGRNKVVIITEEMSGEMSAFEGRWRGIVRQEHIQGKCPDPALNTAS